MTIKKLLNKIEINKYTYILIFISLLAGLIKEISAVALLLLIHELGHYTAAKMFKWNINKIIFYPFGGIIKFEDVIDKPLIEEFIITIMGPLFQIIAYIIFYYLNKKYIVSDYFFSLIRNYNFGILIFNILPIIPLDGSKLLNIIFNKIFNFRKSYMFSIYISIIFLFIFINYLKNDTSYYVLFIFLMCQILINIKNKNFTYQRFILEKKLYSNNYMKYKNIKNIKNMYRNKKHLIYKNNMYMTEKNYLKNKIY